MNRFTLDHRATAELAKAIGRSRIAEGLNWPGSLLDLERALVSVIADQSGSGTVISLDSDDGRPDSGLMTFQEAADALTCSVSTVKRLVRDGELATVRVGKRPRITPAALTHYLGADIG